MMWTMTCRVIASVVTFLIGWTVFAIARPTEELRLPERTPPNLSDNSEAARLFRRRTGMPCLRGDVSERWHV